MDKLFASLAAEAQSGRATVLLTIIDSEGSTPQKMGTHQLVLADGSTQGSIGGGQHEFLACRAARECLAQAKSQLLQFSLAAGGTVDMVCGGQLQVFCQYIAPTKQVVDFFLAIANSKAQQRQLFFDFTEPQQWGMAYRQGDKTFFSGAAAALARLQENKIAELGLGQRTGCFEQADGHFYCELLRRQAHVYIFGAGHIAVALVPLLARLNFTCTVIDDRLDFATKERFQAAADCSCLDYHDLSSLSLQADDYVCIMTHGHAGDYLVQSQLLKTPLAYLGVIGSQKKIALAKERLLQAGFTAEQVDACHAPIGIPISAAEPEEIAVSIAAELIAIRARREGREKAAAKRLWQ